MEGPMGSFDIQHDESGKLALAGRFDAGQVKKAEPVFEALTGTTVLDFSGLKYISSVGLGILVSTQQRLKSEGHKLSIVGASDHIRELFRITRFDILIDIE
jgi:anti-anti-sigma factor